MKNLLLRLAAIFAILLIAVLVAVFLVQMRPEPPKKEKQSGAPLVEVLVLEHMSAAFRVGSQGTVLPRTETLIGAEVSGTITSISPKFTAGGVFGKDEVLLRIDPTNYQVALDQAEALVKQRQIEFDGAEKLRRQGYRAEAEFASAAAALAGAKAELVRARRNLERTYIRVPYEGIVRSKDVDLGQFVTTGMRLGVVFATDTAEVRLPLTDRDLAFVDLPDVNAVAATGVAAGPEVVLSAVQKGRLQQWTARIVRSEGVVDEKSRVTYAVARITDPYRRHGDGVALPMGTFVTASIAGAPAENVFRVPRSLVRGTDELIFMDDDDRLRIRKVDIVRADADYVYVAGGASPGDRVVRTTLEMPINGMKLRTKDADEAAAAAKPAVVEEG